MQNKYKYTCILNIEIWTFKTDTVNKTEIYRNLDIPQNTLHIVD